MKFLNAAGMNFMSKLLIAVISCLVLVACETTDRPPFRRMTELELQAYNQTVELPSMVYCFDEVRTGSFIKKKYCFTLLEIANAANNNAHALGALNYGGGGRYTPGYSPIRSRTP